MTTLLEELERNELYTRAIHKGAVEAVEIEMRRLLREEIRGLGIGCGTCFEVDYSDSVRIFEYKGILNDVFVDSDYDRFHDDNPWGHWPVIDAVCVKRTAKKTGKTSKPLTEHIFSKAMLPYFKAVGSPVAVSGKKAAKGDCLEK